MNITAEHRVDDVLVERAFSLDDIDGVLWTSSTASVESPAPLILLGQPGGFALERMLPSLRARARSAAASGIAAVAIEQPGAGRRPALPGAAEVRAELREVLGAGRSPSEDLIDRLILPLVDRAVPEWRAVLDAVLQRDEIGDRVAVSGGVVSIATRLAIQDPRIVAAGLFAGSFVPRSILEEARSITIPIHMLLQWDDEGNDRQRALELFDTFGSAEKTLQANLGGHTGVPPYAGEDAAHFFARHLHPETLSPPAVDANP
ncbi:alpha/beta hydrolase [Microbacterium sp. ZW T5_56]|uniref:alpha/beta hydrolase n=1 Tax=Microbacterium sp. ZW T5_56 TaxID=3378081 RepID=UPI0038530E2B